LGLVAVIITVLYAVLYAGIDTPEAPAQDEVREGTGHRGQPRT